MESKWNEAIEYILAKEYSDLSEEWKIFYLCYFLDAEVQNGGFIQYFTNTEGKYLSETITALSVVGAKEQRILLERIINLDHELGMKDLNSTKEYIDLVLVGYDYKFKNKRLERKFDKISCDLDLEYYNLEPSTTELLEAYIQDNNMC